MTKKLPVPVKEPELGHYRLKQDVVNPRPDKRTTRWPGEPLWKQGATFVVVKRFHSGFQICKPGEATYRGIGVGPVEDDKSDALRAEALVANFERIEDTLKSLYTQHQALTYWPWSIPSVLIDMGKITLNDVREALIKFNEPEPSESDPDKQEEEDQ